MSLGQGLLLWYTTGLIGALMIDYVESCIVNRDYEKYKNNPNWDTTYLGGIRPPAYQLFIVALAGVIILAIGINSVYNFYKGYYGEFK